VILFSFGTMADTDQMPDRIKLAFLDAFASFHGYHVIWKYRPNEADKKLLQKYTNVHAFDWIDQVSVLGKPLCPDQGCTTNSGSVNFPVHVRVAHFERVVQGSGNRISAKINVRICFSYR
jgi:hypothetical protein